MNEFFPNNPEKVHKLTAKEAFAYTVFDVEVSEAVKGYISYLGQRAMADRSTSDDSQLEAKAKENILLSLKQSKVELDGMNENPTVFFDFIQEFINHYQKFESLRKAA